MEANEGVHELIPILTSRDDGKSWSPNYKATLLTRYILHKKRSNKDSAGTHLAFYTILPIHGCTFSGKINCYNH
jgi:hypothetical protein